MQEKKKISSPYTLERKRSLWVPPLVIYIVIAFVILMIVYFIFSNVQNDDFKEEHIVYVNDEEVVLS